MVQEQKKTPDINTSNTSTSNNNIIKPGDSPYYNTYTGLPPVVPPSAPSMISPMMQPGMYPPQQMYYYQPFRPQTHPGYPPQGYPTMQMQMPMFYPPMLPYPTAPFNAQTPVTQVQPQKPVSQVQVKNITVPAIVKQTPRPPANPKTFSNNNQRSNTPPVIAIPYNLDDPVELEKWKAERRKKFPTGKKGEEPETSEKVEPIKEGISDTKEQSISSSTPVKNTLLEPEHEESEEEGAISEPLDVKRKKICKFFSRGRCTKGDSCPFEHTARPSNLTNSAKNKKIKLENKSRTTIFENLLEIEEKESMMKFYECIKLIVMK